MHHSQEAFSDVQKAFMDSLNVKDAALREEALRLQLGATGHYPGGKLAEHDEGELQFAVGTLQGKVIVNFGKPVASLGMTPAQARLLAKSLRAKAGELGK